MDKLKGLFQKAGVSEALSSQIIEEMNSYTKSVQEGYEKKFHDRLAKARMVCLEQIGKEKSRLAKKVAVYLESKKEHIDKAAEKQRLNEESEATSTLKRVRAMVEGITIDDQGQNQDLQAARRQVSRLQKAAATLKEERDLAVRKANEANQIALKKLQDNKLLEEKLKVATTITESKTTSTKPAEKPATKEPVITEAVKPAPRRLDSKRQVPANGHTTRPAQAPSQTTSGGKSTTSNGGIAGIAAQMDE